MTFGIIYLSLDTTNGLIYVGQDTKNDPYYFGSGKRFLRALKANGRENFKKFVLDEASNQAELDAKEIHWIAATRARDPEIGYNILVGGHRGLIFTEEMRRKISLSKKGKPLGPLSEETKRKMSQNSARLSGKDNPMYGKHHTDEFKRKRSEALRGDKNPRYGTHLSEETRRKLSEAHRGKQHSEETRCKMSESQQLRRMAEGHADRFAKPIRPITDKLTLCAIND